MHHCCSIDAVVSRGARSHAGRGIGVGVGVGASIGAFVWFRFARSSSSSVAPRRWSPRCVRRPPRLSAGVRHTHAPYISKQTTEAAQSQVPAEPAEHAAADAGSAPASTADAAPPTDAPAASTADIETEALLLDNGAALAEHADEDDAPSEAVRELELVLDRLRQLAGEHESGAQPTAAAKARALIEQVRVREEEEERGSISIVLLIAE